MTIRVAATHLGADQNKFQLVDTEAGLPFALYYRNCP